MRARGWEFHIEHTTIGEVIDDMLDAGETPCSLCARLRRGVLYRLAKQVGATKIALGHHLDDFVETLLLNLFFAGALKAMPARLVSDNGAHVVIRPLRLRDRGRGARLRARRTTLPVIGCCCPACGDLSLQRQRVKRLIMELEREHPHIKASMLKAIGNVMPRHLLDRRLNPNADLAREVVDQLDIRALASPFGSLLSIQRRPADPDARSHPARALGAGHGRRTASPARLAPGSLVFVGVERGRRSEATSITSPRRSGTCGFLRTMATHEAASG